MVVIDGDRVFVHSFVCLFVFGWLVWLCFLFLFLIYDHEHYIPGVEVRGQLLWLVFSLNPFGEDYLLLLLRSWAQQLADLQASCRFFLSLPSHCGSTGITDGNHRICFREFCSQTQAVGLGPQTVLFIELSRWSKEGTLS